MINNQLTQSPDGVATSGVLLTLKYLPNNAIQFNIGYPNNEVYIRYISTQNHTAYTDWIKVGEGINFKGKILYTLGDSITAGSYSESDGSATAVSNAEWAYGQQIAKLYGCTCKNLGNPGASSQNILVNQVPNVGSDANIVTVTFGANDYYGTDRIIGEITDTGNDTICGNLNDIIKGIAEKAPLARIVVISPFLIKYGDATIDTEWSYNYKARQFTYKELMEAMQAVAQRNGVEFINGTTNGPTNIYNITSVQYDGVHPSKEFYPTIGQWLGSHLF